MCVCSHACMCLCACRHACTLKAMFNVHTPFFRYVFILSSPKYTQLDDMYCIHTDHACKKILHLCNRSCIYAAGHASMQVLHPCSTITHADPPSMQVRSYIQSMQVLHPCKSCINAGPASMHVLNPCRSYTSETNSNSKSFHEDPASMQHVLHIHAGLTSMQVLHPCMTLHAGPAYIRSFIFIHAGPTFLQILYTCRFYTSETNTNSNHI